MESFQRQLVVVDTDMGPDDAWALIMLLKAVYILKFNVIGITCTHGNSNLDNVAKNTIRILEMMERTDIPVFKGAENPLVYDRDVPNHFFGKDGFGDAEYERKPDISLIKSENGIHALYRLVKERKQNIILIALGPLTNIALALRIYPDFRNYIEALYIMGGNYKGEGNYNSAEYNFQQDPEAAYITLNVMKKPIFVFPWEAIVPPRLSLTPEWRFNELGKVDTPVTRLMNVAEHMYQDKVKWSPADVGAVAIYINPNQVIRIGEKVQASIELNGRLTRGQMVIDRTTNKTNIFIVEEVNETYFKNMLLWTAGHDNVTLQLLNFE